MKPVPPRTIMSNAAVPGIIASARLSAGTMPTARAPPIVVFRKLRRSCISASRVVGTSSDIHLLEKDRSEEHEHGARSLFERELELRLELENGSVSRAQALRPLA